MIPRSIRYDLPATVFVQAEITGTSKISLQHVFILLYSQVALKLCDSEDFQRFRGLEHLASQKLCLARGMTALNATTEVLLAQVSTRHFEGDDTHLARSYATSNLPAVRFARILGIADAAVVANNEEA